MHRLIAVTLVLALVSAGAALAADPKKRINPADQARARAMLLRQADVGLGYRAVPGSSSGSALAPSCAALDESDLTVTGEAESPTFTSGLQTFTSAAGLYVSVADSSTSWRRTTSAAGFKCLTDVFRRAARSAGARFVSFRKLSFPALAPRTVAYRAQDQANGVRVYADIVLLMRGRAHTALVLISGIDPLERSETLHLARLVSGRMAKAMRGS